MLDVMPRIESLQGKDLGNATHVPPSSEGAGSVREFDGVDWSGAAPNWASIISGFFLPPLAAIAVIILIDFAFCSLLGRWISWSMTPWFTIMMFPVALLCAFVGAKLFLNFKQLLQGRSDFATEHSVTTGVPQNAGLARSGQRAIGRKPESA
jgi:hypothetical protein